MRKKSLSLLFFCKKSFTKADMTKVASYSVPCSDITRGSRIFAGVQAQDIQIFTNLARKGVSMLCRTHTKGDPLENVPFAMENMVDIVERERP